MNFVVFGAGSWGTATAIHIARAGQAVSLVPRRAEQAEALGADRENKDYLPGHAFPEGLKVTSDVSEVLKGADVVLLACPSKALRELADKIKNNLGGCQPKAYITLCKGVESGTFLPPVTVLKEIFPDAYCGVFSGPTFAGEVATGKPTAITLAFDEIGDVAESIQQCLSDRHLRVYTSTDVDGVEYAGCLKNIYAIGAGIIDGFELGDNCKATYLTRSLHELVKIGKLLGGEVETFYGLSGFGDLVATCFGAWSRNRTFGQKIAEGMSPEAIIKSQKTVVEGYGSVENFHHLLKKHSGLKAPILEELYAILFEGKDAKEARQALMMRDLKAEI